MALGGCATSAPHRPSVLGGETAHTAVRKPRVVVTTDPELDDSNSLIRYLLYSTDFRTEGLVYASSQFQQRSPSKRSCEASKASGRRAGRRAHRRRSRTSRPRHRTDLRRG